MVDDINVYMVNEKIKEELKRRNISYASLAKAIGFTYDGLHQLLNKRKDIKVSVLKKISDFLDVPIISWFEDEEQTMELNENPVPYKNVKNELSLKEKYEKLIEENEHLKTVSRLQEDLINLQREQIKSLKKLK